MPKRSKKSSSSSSGDVSTAAAAAAASTVDSPHMAVASPASSKSIRVTHSKKGNHNNGMMSINGEKMDYPLPVGVTDMEFTKDYINPNNKLKRLARRVFWAWNIHAVSAMFDTWEIVLLNGTALVVTTAVGFYCANTAMAMFA